MFFLVYNGLNAQVFFADCILDPGQQIGAQMSGVIGKFDQMPMAFIKNLEGEAVPAML
jgi:hypothetical protein